MIGPGEHTRIYLVSGATDMRKQIDGLAALVVDVLDADPMGDALFVFTNRGRDKLKILFWAGNGFWLWYRRLERERFHWPQSAPGESSVRIDRRQLQWLLDGLQWSRVQGHCRADLAVL